MKQCVPNWDLEDPPNGPPNRIPSSSSASNVSTLMVKESKRSECKVTELTWENGQLSMHSLGQPRIGKPIPTYPSASWDKKARPTGTLEAVVDQATRALLLIPEQLVCAGGGRKRPRTPVNDTWEMEAGFTTTSTTQSPWDGDGSQDTSLNGQDSACHSKLSDQGDGVGDEEEDEVVTQRGTAISSTSTKRTRAAAVHNQSERKRRDRITQKMRTLQKLVPNSSKTDKASMLDEVIEYMKQLQAQIQMMTRMSNIPPMMIPMGMQHLQLSMMAQMAQMAQMAHMGMGMGMMDLGSFGRPRFGSMPPVHPAASTFIPLPGAVVPEPFPAAGLGNHAQQPMNMDAYNRMVAMYQQLYHTTPPSNPHT